MTDRARSQGRLQMVFVAAVLAAVAGCGELGLGPTTPTAEIVDVQVKDLAMTTATLLFDVEVSNPYSQALPLTGVEYVLSSGGERFLSGDASLEGEIPAGGSQVLPIPVKLDFMRIVSMLQDVSPGSTMPYDADVALSVELPLAGTFRLPMKKSGELDIPRMPSVSLP